MKSQPLINVSSRLCNHLNMLPKGDSLRKHCSICKIIAEELFPIRIYKSVPYVLLIFYWANLGVCSTGLLPIVLCQNAHIRDHHWCFMKKVVVFWKTILQKYLQFCIIEARWHFKIFQIWRSIGFSESGHVSSGGGVFVNTFQGLVVNTFKGTLFAFHMKMGNLEIGSHGG